MKKIISSLLVIMMLASALMFSGCSVDTKGAESMLKVYFSALSSFNTVAMDGCVESDTKDSIGFSTENISYEYTQTNNYKNSVEDMYRALGQTFEFTIDSTEVKDDDKVAFKVTVKYADVDEEAMTEYTNGKVDEFVAKNPYFFEMNEVEQNDKAIEVIADAYNQYLQLTNKAQKNFELIVSKHSGDWQIYTKDNKEFFDFLSVLFG